MTAGSTQVDRSRVLVDAAWMVDHLDDPSVVLLEVDDRPALNHRGHLPGAQLLDWARDLQDPVRRDLPTPEAIASLWRRVGVRATSTVVFYGDLHNWLAAYGCWLFRAYGLADVRLLDGGRGSWIAQALPLTTRPPDPADEGPVPVPRLDPTVRATRAQVVDAARHGALLDVRTPQEYVGEWLTEPEYPGEAAHRPGHIPAARNLPWDAMITPDGLVRPEDELESLFAGAGVTRDRPLVLYCRVGERSAHTWLLLHDLLGYRNATNYEGSWTERGSMTGMPIQLGPDPGHLPDLAGPTPW
ncbi:sulfurtransferase [Microlunatus antarcticus]